MNKILQQTVKDKCKDMGLSEESLNGVTEILGGEIADDSTDNAAIEAVANRIVEVAKRMQGEATRWAQGKFPQPTPPVPPTPPTPPTPPAPTESDEMKKWREDMDKRFKAIEDENKLLRAERQKQERTAKIGAAFTKHHIPEYLREYVTVPDSVEDAKIDEYVGGMAQKFVTQQLPGMEDSSRQVASKEETQAAADKFFENLNVKPKENQ